jgi:hypothetical protein
MVLLTVTSLGFLDLDCAANPSLNKSAALIVDSPPYIVPELGGSAAFPTFPTLSFG